ncbi:phosphotransferase [Curtobacterium sp. RRHDQ10]|uniref:phosphotransferase n=1 Tax=Curtobacterium phyllosphaerae TaxID=3413379 RepID=UPI003BF14DD8
MHDIDGLPSRPVDVPAEVLRIAAARGVPADGVVPVWVNAVGGLTFRLDGGAAGAAGAGGAASAGGAAGAGAYLKWAPHGTGLDLRGEIARLSWARRYTAVPRVLDQGVDDDARWVLTAAMPGSSAVDPRWHDDPRPAVVAAGVGLRALHDALPVGECPFEWAVPTRIARSGASDEQIAALGPAPSPDRIVVCHGDPCTPNTLVHDDGRWAGHVDLDALGIADRWADIGVATMSLGWNFGPGWEGVFLDAYGIDPDEERSTWYRALWNLGDPNPPSDQSVPAA